MNFNLSEDQTMLKDTAERLFGDPVDGLWGRMAELGLLAAPFSEDHGGLGLGPIETMIIAEAAGQAQALSAYGAAVVAAGTAMRLSPEVPAEAVEALAGGQRIIVWAHEEAGLSETAARTTSVRQGGGEWRVTGGKTNIVHAVDADAVVITADLDGDPAVLLVSLSEQGIGRRDYTLFDGSPACELSLEDAPVERVLATGEAARVLIERTREHLVAWRAAEATGLMQGMLDATLEHLKTRRQFGETLSSFQALRHRAAEMLVALEQARSMAMLAALSVDEGDPEARREAIGQVRSVVGRSSRFVAQAAVQLHGGVGVTEEHPVGRGFRRLTMIDLEMERV
jgi:alkylation response protein AidB-like acyl-CoA dehydrogenase